MQLKQCRNPLSHVSCRRCRRPCKRRRIRCFARYPCGRRRPCPCRSHQNVPCGCPCTCWCPSDGRRHPRSTQPIDRCLYIPAQQLDLWEMIYCDCHRDGRRLLHASPPKHRMVSDQHLVATRTGRTIVISSHRYFMYRIDQSLKWVRKYAVRSYTTPNSGLPYLDRIDYIVVWFMTHYYSRKLWKNTSAKWSWCEVF